MSSDVAKRESAAPRQLGADEDFDVEVDVIVVGLRRQRPAGRFVLALAR
jgi:hypothetical protein